MTDAAGNATPRPAGLLTASDLAERWQVPVSQVYALTRRGDVPVVRIGRYVRFRLAEIETFEAQGGHGA